MSQAVAGPAQARAGREVRELWPGLALVAGAAVFIAVLARPALDGTWENHAAHFWLVLTAAALNVAFGYAVGSAAGRRRDARLLLVSLAFVSGAGFLGLHALATPGVLIGKNAGFELATPVGSHSRPHSRPPRACRFGRPRPSACSAGRAPWPWRSPG